MKVSYDPKRDIIRIKFQDGKYDISRETDEGVVIDMTKDNKILAIEIANVSERIPNKNIKELTIGIEA